MIQFVITKLNFARAFSYECRDVTVQWSLQGLVINPLTGPCRIANRCCDERQVIPWDELLPLRNCTLICPNEKIAISLRTPENESDWIHFVKNGEFPAEEKLNAYQAYFEFEFALRTLQGTLNREFFQATLTAYAGIDLGSRNPRVMDAIDRWESRQVDYLSSQLIDAKMDSPQTQRIISEIKSFMIKKL